MEKKKLLLVSVAVGLFLVIAIGASVLVFSPRDYHSVTRAEAVPAELVVPPGISVAMPEVATPPSEPVQPTHSAVSEQPAASDPPVAAVTETVSANERNAGNIIYITAGGSAEDAVRVERLNDGNTTTYIMIPAPSENVVPAAATPAASARPPTVAVPAAVATPAAAPPAQKKPAAAPKPAATPTAVAAKTEVARGSQSWWVQTNSYSKKAYADHAKKFLETKGITSVVTNGNVGGKTYYRVRVGPYSSQAEADYWLSLIKTIEGMENSLVWKSSSL
jgi:DedD protein